MRRILFLLLKAALSTLLVYLSVRAVDVASVGARLAAAKAPWLAVAATLGVTQLILLAVRWREIAHAGNTQFTFKSALQFTFIGAFFSQVLPSTIGGDAARIFLLARRGGGWSHAAYSVLIDRVVGVTMLAAVVIACLPWTMSIIHDPLARSVLLLIGFGAAGGAGIFLALAFVPARLAARMAVIRHLGSASRMAWTLCRCPRPSLVLLATSLLVHLSTVAMVWACAQTVMVPVSFLDILFLLPPVLLIATVPVSIAGWGLREGSMVAAFGYAGLAPSDGLTLSILFGLVSFAVGAIGGGVWIASGLRRLPFVASEERLSIAEQARP